MSDRERLKVLSERVTMQVNSVHGYVTKGEADELERLRGVVGEKWDAINGKWGPLED